jgi:hypothetical protein
MRAASASARAASAARRGAAVVGGGEEIERVAFERGDEIRRGRLRAHRGVLAHVVARELLAGGGEQRAAALAQGRQRVERDDPGVRAHERAVAREAAAAGRPRAIEAGAARGGPPAAAAGTRGAAAAARQAPASAHRWPARLRCRTVET